IQQLLDGFCNADLSVVRKLPVKVDTPGLGHIYCLTWYLQKSSQISDFFLLLVADQGIHSKSIPKWVKTNITIQNIECHILQIQCVELPDLTANSEVLSVDWCTLKLEIQKNVHKGACVHHEAHGALLCCLVAAFGWQVVHI
ncbi:hypothetical protein ACHAXS_005833, partial [Conticribra weissflogii]